MDLNRVAVFVKVVDEGGFTAAAKALGLPKSSVSRSVALLEAELGALLLSRSTRKIALTEAGALFYERASRGLAAVAEAGEEVSDLTARLRGSIRITASVDVGTWILAPVVAAFVSRHPEVCVEAVLSARVADLVEEGFDLALRAGAIKDESLVARKLAPIELALFASRAYLEANGVPVRVADLAHHRAVLFRATRGEAMWTLRGPGGEESVRVRGVASADEFAFLHTAAAAGAGIALLPSFIPDGGLERVLPKHTTAGAPLHIVYPSTRYVPRRVAAFRDFALDTLGASAVPRRRRSG